MRYRRIPEPALTPGKQFIGVILTAAEEDKVTHCLFGEVRDGQQRWRVINGGFEWRSWPAILMGLQLTTNQPVVMRRLS